jgi:hypothetical protein
MSKNSLIFTGLVLLILIACKKEKKSPKTSVEPNLILIFDFDSTQVRLNAFGQPVEVADGHAAQNPKMNGMSAHYVELAPGAYTPVGSGSVIYHASETNSGGENAIDFTKALIGGKGFQFLKIPLKEIAKNDYEYLRVSLGYQNFDITYYVDTTITVPGFNDVHIAQDFPATVASFVGFNSYIKDYKINTETITVNANRKQGYWGFESKAIYNGYPINYTTTGQAPEGATTVVNPLAATSPIPAGSCLVTGRFHSGKLKITGNETKDIVIRVSLSTNKSFEWIDSNGNGKWEPTKGEKIIDMGLRGLIPYIQ